MKINEIERLRRQSLKGEPVNLTCPFCLSEHKTQISEHRNIDDYIYFKYKFVKPACCRAIEVKQEVEIEK